MRSRALTAGRFRRELKSRVRSRALIRRVRGQEPSAAEEHPVPARMAPLDDDAILELARLARHPDRDLTRADRSTVQQTDTMAADLACHRGDRVSAGRGDFGRHREFKTIRRSSVFHIRFSDAFQDATEVPKCWPAPGIGRHRVIVFFVVVGCAKQAAGIAAPPRRTVMAAPFHHTKYRSQLASHRGLFRSLHRQPWFRGRLSDHQGRREMLQKNNGWRSQPFGRYKLPRQSTIRFRGSDVIGTRIEPIPIES